MPSSGPTEGLLSELPETLREASPDARYARIVELASDAILSVDESQRIVTFNQGATRIFGHTAEEILGQPLDVLLPPAFRDLHKGFIREFAESGVTARQMGERRAISGMRKGGEIFPAEASILKQEEKGRFLYTVLLRDVSRRMRRERGERFLSGLGAALASSLDVTDTLQRIVRRTVEDWSDVAILFLLGEAGASRVAEVGHQRPEDQPEVDRLKGPLVTLPSSHPLAEGVASGVPTVFDLTDPLQLQALSWGEAADSTLRTLEVGSALSVPLVARGRTLGLLLCLRKRERLGFAPEELEWAPELGRRAGMSIDNARLYQEARRALEARDDVLGVVSHDLGNPLQAIFIGIEALERTQRRSDGEEGLGGGEYYLSAIRRSAEVMERLIQDLLEVRRVESGGLVLKRETQPLAPLMTEALARMDPLARVRSVTIETVVDLDGAPDPPLDADRIQQVLSNLLGNAVKHTPEGGRVTLRATRDGEDLCVTVEDTGPGLPQEELDRVFEPFWRGSTGRGPGVGLGLAIARGIVLAHGGRIWAESTLGEGCRFNFSLPTSPAPSTGGFLPRAGEVG